MELLEKLKKLNTTKSLEKRWQNMKFATDCKILNKADLQCLGKSQNQFDRFVQLKELISKRARGSFSNLDLNFWIINTWGGIKTFQRNTENERKMLMFSEELKLRKLSKRSFETISSLSKMASFIDPTNYVIYDSRVAYSLNWLILTTKPTGIKFFPMPTGRNKLMRGFDLKTIIHLTHLKQYKRGDILFYSEGDAYFEFCALVKTLSNDIYRLKSKPYLLEMLLFQIFEEEIHQEVLSKTSVKITL